MITGLSIRNFKNLAAVPPAEGDLVPFGPLNVLIGPNGCGKSSLLHAIDFLKAFFESSVEVYLNEREWIYSELPNLHKEGRKIHWRVRAELGPDGQGRYAGTYDYSISLQPRRYLGIGEERLVYTAEADGEPVLLLHRAGRECEYLDRRTGERKKEAVQRQPCSFYANLDPDSDEAAAFPEALHFRGWVEEFQPLYVCDPVVLRQPSEGQGCRMGERGENLAGSLLRIKKEDPAAFGRLVKRVHSLVPTFTGLEFDTILPDLHYLQQQEGDATFNSYQMSDGVLRLLAVASLLYTPKPPSVVLFEEPENGIHPQLVRHVVQMLRELTERKASSQVFLTTHSPYLLDEFYHHPGQVYCMERQKPQEGAGITRLIDLKQLPAVQQVYERESLGEAWFSGLLGATSRN